MLVDTSVWIESFAPRSRVITALEREELASAIVDGEAKIVLPIYSELLSGAKHADRELLSSLPFVDLEWSAPPIWEAVADLGQAAHARRLRIPGVADRMILLAAREAGETLWALDGPLRRLAKAIGVDTR